MSIPTVFISYSHLDEPWKDRLVKHLGIAQKQGLLQTWNDRALLGGDDWLAEIINAIKRGSVAVLLVSQNSLTSNFILNEEAPRMLAQREVKAARFYPIVVEDCDWEAVEWLKQFNLRPHDGRPVGINSDGKRREEQTNRDFKEIAKEIRLSLPLPEASPAHGQLTGECPYLGLEAFTEDKEHLFFGRNDFADALFDKVKRNNFVALVGPSGSGKSSVVQAGLFPRLRRDTQPWETILFPPGEDPFLSLAAGFVWLWQPKANPGINTNEAKKLSAELKDAQLLIEAIQRTAAVPDGRLLLVVDQFEELFTLCSESDRRAFFDVLLAVKEVAPATFLLTLRSDFTGQAQSFSPAFSQLLDDGIVSHRPLTRADLEAVITGPTRYAGLEFEPGLVNLILQEVAAQPDSLPLLEYALKEMWRKRQSQVIGHALYEAVGKVEGAISQHADAVLLALPEAEQALALRALTRLVRVAGEDGEADTRLRLPLSELSEAELAVLQTFVTARLLVTNREKGAGAETIEVAHEALIRQWEKLRKALDSDREFLMWRRRLDFRRRDWEENQRHDSLLLQGLLLEEARRWRKERGLELTSAEIGFITWEDRPEFQIERILAQGPDLSRFDLTFDERHEDVSTSWFVTLVFCGKVELAISNAREIEDENALASISTALLKSGLISKAQELASEMFVSALATDKARYERDSALNSVAKALAKVGLISEALATMREIGRATTRASAIISVVDILVKLGLADKAREMALEGLTVVQKELDNNPHYLSRVVEALAKLGMTAEARGMAAEVLTAARKENNLFLEGIALPLARAGMVTEALTVLREFTNVYIAYDRVDMLRSIAKALAKAGFKAEAVSIALEIEDKHYCASVLSSVSKALAKVNSTAARELALKALMTTHEIKDEFYYASTLTSVAEALAELGMAEEAQNAISEALSDARETEDAWDLMHVIDFWLMVGEIENARSLIEEVQIAIGKIYSDHDRSFALGHLAEIFARLHDYRSARETAEKCSISADQLSAYTAILREYHIERDPSLARLFAEEKEEEEDD